MKTSTRQLTMSRVGRYDACSQLKVAAQAGTRDVSSPGNGPGVKPALLGF